MNDPGVSAASSRVLLATDLSRPAKRAARFLARLPFPKPPVVRLVQTVELPVGPLTFHFDDEWPALFVGARDAARAALKEEAEAFAGLTEQVSVSVRHGLPAEETLAEAGRFGADLIVTGAVGHGAVERALLGSVSDRVATHAACPVLIVRGTNAPGATIDEADRTGGDAGPPDRPPRVIVGCDGSPASRSAARAIAEFDWPPQTRVTLLSFVLPVAPDWAAADWPGVLPTGDYEAMIRAERERAGISVELASLPFRDRGLDVRTEVAETDHVGDALCDRAELEDADLLVVADKGHNAFTRFLVGSVTRFVLRHSARPVWLHRGGRG
ncbi:universal stress protein [Alienimonas sp. DA493]|uniref:universal stress protein n=1 Tax=Alienimonas sp. DA493 TaxID=3373605 RepID=UPI003755186E